MGSNMSRWTRVLSWTLLGLLIPSVIVAQEPAAEPLTAQATTDSSLTANASTDGSSIVGFVRDAEDGRPLAYTNIVAYSREGGRGAQQVGGTMAVTGGQFFLRIPPGRYDLVFLYIGYERVRVEDLEVADNDRIELDIQLEIEPVFLDVTTVVQARRITTSEIAQDQAKRTDEAVTDFISKDQISKTGDGDAAAALTRVTGISVVGGKYVFVRGLGDRYSSTALNGAMLGSPEPSKRTVPLDIFPTAIFDNVVIQKTFTPDMNGEFGGGVVDVRTSDFIGDEGLKHSISTGFAENGTKRSFLHYSGGRWDFFGFDDGKRGIPDAILEATRDGKALRRGVFERDELIELRRSFANVWEPRRNGLPPNLGYTGSFSKGVEVLGADLGFLASLTHKTSANSRERNEIALQSNGEVETDTDISESTFETLTGATATLNLLAGKGNAVKLNLLWTRSSDDRARVSEGPNFNYGVDNVTRYQLAYRERDMASAVLSGAHPVLFGTKIDWKLSYSGAQMVEPDRREVTYEATLATSPLRLSRRNTPYTRVFGQSREDSRSFQVDWKVPFIQANLLKFEMKTGLAGWERERGASYRQFDFNCDGTFSLQALFACGTPADLELAPEDLLLSANQDPHWIVEESTRVSDQFWGRHSVRAQYVMADTKVGDRIRIVGGVRWERSQQKLDTVDDQVAGGEEPVHLDLLNRDPLPSANVTFSLSDRMNLRAGFSRTVNRPELRELATTKTFDYDAGVILSGNPRLQQAKIEAYDLRWEVYPGLRQYLGLSVFYKDLIRPIEQTLRTDVGGSEIRTPINVDTGILRGFEAELRTSMAGLWRLARLRGTDRLLENPGFWERLTLSFNYSRVHSETNLGEFQRPLTGQSSYSANLGMFYSGGRHDLSLSLQKFGERLFGFNVASSLEDTYEQPITRLDASYGIRVGETTKLKFSGRNLLDEELEFTQGDLTVRRWRPGRTFGISLNYGG